MSRYFPSYFEIDALTRYIYRHFHDLLTDEERAAERVRTARVKQWDSADPEGTRVIELLRVPEVQRTYPELLRRIDENGFANVMRAAADRVLREHSDKKILHICARCGELCRTPTAKQCFECGFDWHSDEG